MKNCFQCRSTENLYFCPTWKVFICIDCFVFYSQGLVLFFAHVIQEPSILKNPDRKKELLLAQKTVKEFQGVIKA